MPIERRTIPDRETWLGWRRGLITSTSVAALFGLNPWKTALQVWADIHGLAPEPRETPAMRRGRWLEPAVELAMSEAYPRSLIEKANVFLVDAELRLGATPDAFMGKTLVEYKVISRPVFNAWQGEAPIYYQLQALTAAMMADSDKAILACLVIDTYDAALELFHLNRNPIAEARIRDGVAMFWEAVAAGERPPADYGSDGEIIARLYGPVAGTPHIDLSTDNRLPEILAEREGLRRNIAAYEARSDAIRAEVIEKMNGAQLAVCGDWRISHKLIHQPEQIRKATSFPRLTVTRKREAPE